MSNLQPAKARLSGVAKELRRQWLDVKDTWRDAKCDEFERLYLEELFDEVGNAVTAMDDLNKILKKIREDCTADAEITGR
ncbi:MAG: hypothetical protein HKN23_10065 [Verrucomicrobiales bacterium]|nr:hypothetical protein [Verrucomicrobiales bacterium]